MKKTTLATVKSFIRKNRSNGLLIKVKSTFDGMTDGIEQHKGAEFNPALEGNRENECGVAGAWFVLGGGDRFNPYEDAERVGIEVWNCCGSFVLAIPKPATTPAAVEAPAEVPALRLYAPAN